MTTRIERIAYYSCATRNSPGAYPSLIQILAVSQRNNARDEITGALAVSRGRYFQVVEGPTVALEGLLRRIGSDVRHEGVTIVDRRKIDSRLFGDWTMVAPKVTPELEAEIDAAVDQCQIDSERAVDLLLYVLRRQAAGA